MEMAAQQTEAIYSPGHFMEWDEANPWAPEDVCAIHAVLSAHCPVQVGPMFNTWLFVKDGCLGFCAKRVTWDHFFMWADSASELAAKLDAYYKG